MDTPSTRAIPNFTVVSLNCETVHLGFKYELNAFVFSIFCKFKSIVKYIQMSIKFMDFSHELIFCCVLNNFSVLEIKHAVYVLHLLYPPR